MTLSTEAEAQGVVVDGTVYHIIGREPLEGYGDVLVTEIDELIYQREQEAHLQAASLPATIIFVTMAEAQQLDDVTMCEHSGLFAPWVEGMEYSKGAIRRDPENGDLYRCEQGHTSQAGWEPHNTPALWTRIGDPTVKYPEWSQPIGAQDCYHSGDKVTHKEKQWVSEVDNNVWEPGVYGWTEVKEEEVNE